MKTWLDGRRPSRNSTTEVWKWNELHVEGSGLLSATAGFRKRLLVPEEYGRLLRRCSGGRYDDRISDPKPTSKTWKAGAACSRFGFALLNFPGFRKRRLIILLHHIPEESIQSFPGRYVR
jgi:hypothetical protein